jgi:hypothetical protein
VQWEQGKGYYLEIGGENYVMISALDLYGILSE